MKSRNGCHDRLAKAIKAGFRVLSWWWIGFRLTSLTFCLVLVGQVSLDLPTHTQHETLLSFVTNCPPIKHLVVDVLYFSRRPTMFVFRYQPGAFYARQLSDADPSSPFFHVPKGASCGYWNDEYWHLVPRSGQQPSVLTTGIAAGMDRKLLRHKNAMFEMIFSYFASLGISPSGVNSVMLEDDHLITIANAGDPEHESTIRASIITSNELPVGAQVQPLSRRGLAKPIKVTYVYDTNTVPLPIPKEIILTQRVPRPGLPEDTDPSGDEGIDRTGLHIVVKELQLGDQSSLGPRNDFMPDATLLGTNLIQVIITNGQNFRLRGKELVAMAVPKNVQDRDLRRVVRRRSNSVVLTLLISTALLLPVALVAMRHRYEQKKQPEVKQ